jgi:hypothetical protein
VLKCSDAPVPRAGYHDRDHATLAFARELAADDWKIASAREVRGIH